jgi:hypothetical protein
LNELEKFSWNIECSLKIMDLLNLHLKDLLHTISCAHIQHIQQHQQFLQQQNLNNNNNNNNHHNHGSLLLSTQTPATGAASSSIHNSTYTTQLIFKLEELLNTLINVSK